MLGMPALGASFGPALSGTAKYAVEVSSFDHVLDVC